MTPSASRLHRREIIILGAILIGLIGPLLGSTWYTYRLQSDVRENARRAEIEHIADLLASGMRDPVWNLIPESGRPLLNSTLKNPLVVKIRVRSATQGEFLSGGEEVETGDTGPGG